MRVLLIEDDRRLAERTAEYLGEHGVEVEIADRGELGLERAQSEPWDLVLLDIMLPDLDGLELCRRLRQRVDVPVVMLSARGDEVDRIVGLELGADDYLAKPFSARELLARIRAVLRRHARPAGGAEHGVEGPNGEPAGSPPSPADPGPPTSSDRVLSCGQLRVDRGRRVVELEGRDVELTAYQFDLLWALAEAPEQVLDREHLYNRVRSLRGEAPADFDPSVDRSVDVHLSKVRQALDEARPGASAALRTVRGVGYVLDPGPLSGGDA